MQMMEASVDKSTQSFSTPFAPPTPPGGDPSNGASWSASIALGTTPGPQIIRSPNLAPLSALLTAANFPGLAADIAVRAAALAAFVDTGLCASYPRCAYVNPTPVVAYFPAVCPPQWVDYAPADGRTLIPVDGSAALPTPGAPSGKAWSTSAGALNDPGHTHGYSVGIDLPGNYIATDAPGFPGFSMQLPGYYAFEGLTNASYLSSIASLWQLHTCFLPPTLSAPHNYTFPTGAYAFFDYASTPSCPDGWSTDKGAPPPYGYAIVPSGVTDLSPTSPPLTPGAVLTHTHDVMIEIGTASPIQYYSTLPSGTQLAAQGRQFGTGTTMNNTISGALPYLPLLFCKNDANTDNGLSPRHMMTFAPNCGQLDAAVGPMWTSTSFVKNALILSSSALSQQIGSGGAPITRNDQVFNHSHDSTPTLFSSPPCNSFDLSTSGPNQENPRCTDPESAALDVFDISPAEVGLPPFVQMNLCVVSGSEEVERGA